MPKTNFHRLLEAKINQVVQETAMSIALVPCEDQASYRDMTGYVRGLNDALKLAEDVEKEINE